jgi:NAD(P)-dependent dehydrogenase (short-subunit alcohol dehydrogenase family)
MIGLSHAVATTYARERIRSNVVAPSLVMTPMARRAANNPDTVAYAERKQPLARGFLQAGDIAAAVAWLCGDASAQITGQVIAVDGGWTVSDGR